MTKSVVDAAIRYSAGLIPQELAERVERQLGHSSSVQPLFDDSDLILRVHSLQGASRTQRALDEAMQGIFEGQVIRWQTRVIAEGNEDTPESVLRDLLPALERLGTLPGADHDLLLRLSERVRSVLT